MRSIYSPSNTSNRGRAFLNFSSQDNTPLSLYFFLYISLIPLILLEQADLEFLREVLSQIKLIGRASELILSYERKLMKIASDLRELH
jgi:hypothetical protein